MKKEIIEKYDEATANEIIASKMADPVLKKTCVRDHEDLPDREDLRVYLCWDSSYETDVEDTVIEQLFKASDKDDRCKDKTSKKRKRSTSSSTSDSSAEDTSDEGSSDSSSSSDKKKKKKNKKRASKKNKKSKKKGKKDKKSKKDKEKEEEKAKQKAEKEAEKEAQKAIQKEVKKKELVKLNAAITDVNRIDAKIQKMAPGFQAAMKEELKKYKSPLNTHREKLQQLVDAEVADDIDSAVKKASDIRAKFQKAKDAGTF
ncbi:unnamed protein product [Durusdinium trenchii]|uniref:Uncharacterized protein n=1 Tax=Durusdinium trenchii TaxID=1381693 RepID=A0ABP0N1C7_9DINO